MRFKRSTIETKIEKNFVTALITSDSFCRDIEKVYKPEFLTNSVNRVIAGWTMDYFKKFDKAPDINIADIYEMKKEGLNEADATLVEELLHSLSAEFEQNDRINTPYIFEQSLLYFKKRSLIILADNIKALANNDKADQAEDLLRNHHKLEKAQSKWINVYSDENVIKTFIDQDQNKLFRFPGALGDLIGDFQREWLIAFMGPPKKGKTAWLQEIGLHANLNRFRVAFFSFEMGEQMSNKRSFKRLTALVESDNDEAQDCRYPIFDCYHNQTGECDMSERKNKNIVIEDGVQIEFDPSYEYDVCTHCREHENKNIRDKYDASVWWEQIKREKFEVTTVRSKVNKFIRAYGSNMMTMIYPAFSAGLSDIKRDLDSLEFEHNFIPDVIIVDYADIVRPESAGFQITERGSIDVLWKGLKGLAAERKCLVATASQTNRKSIDSRTVKSTDASEDIRKLNHVDGIFTLNQSNEEKIMGVMRLGATAVRDREFNEMRHVTVLQCPRVGQTLIDSEYVIDMSDRLEQEEDF